MHAEFWLAGWLAGWRAAANPAQMGWKWSEWEKCMTLRARSEKKLHVVQLGQGGWTYRGMRLLIGMHVQLYHVFSAHVYCAHRASIWRFFGMQCMQCMHAGCMPGWRRKWADLPTLTRARAGRQWPVPKTDARIMFLVEFWV